MRPKYGTPYLFTSANPILFFTRHLKTHYFISAHLAPALAASVMRPDSLPRLWRYMSLTYLLTYNTRQFITEFLNKDWTKNSINRLLVKFGIVDTRQTSGQREAQAHADENVNS